MLLISILEKESDCKQRLDGKLDIKQEAES
jgi:hypothetical protein